MLQALTTEELKYPVGKFQKPAEITQEHLLEWIETIAAFPKKLTTVLHGITDEQLQWKYRPGSWNIRQLVNHCADSHMNAFIRFKLALTEENPTIKPYKEAFWAATEDAKNTPIEYSLQILQGLHFRLAKLLKSLRPEDWERTFHHPEHNRQIALKESCGMYAWHGEHHLAHIKQALQYENNFAEMAE